MLYNWNLFLFNNYFSWHKKYIIWQFFFSGFYFDDIFSKIIKLFFFKFLNLPTFFVLDKWVSFWSGAGLFKNYLKLFNKLFYFEKLNFSIFILFLSFSIIFMFIIFFILLYFLL